MNRLLYQLSYEASARASNRSVSRGPEPSGCRAQAGVEPPRDAVGPPRVVRDDVQELLVVEPAGGADLHAARVEDSDLRADVALVVELRGADVSACRQELLHRLAIEM